jgi:hypothetical protein
MASFVGRTQLLQLIDHYRAAAGEAARLMNAAYVRGQYILYEIEESKLNLERLDEEEDWVREEIKLQHLWASLREADAEYGRLEGVEHELSYIYAGLRRFAAWT